MNLRVRRSNSCETCLFKFSLISDILKFDFVAIFSNLDFLTVHCSGAMLDCVCCLHFEVLFFTFHFFVLFTLIFVYNHGLWEQFSLLCISVHIPLSVRWLFPQRAQTNNRGRHYRWPIIVALTTQLSLFHQENTKDEHNKCINNNNNVTTSP